MDRRALLKSSVGLMALGGAGAAQASSSSGIRDWVRGVGKPEKETRKVFKIVHTTQQPITHVRAGSDDWTPSQEELDALASAFSEAERDRDMVVVTSHDVWVESLPSYVLVKCGFMELKRDDVFVLYEETGERVPGVWKCGGDAYLGTGGVPSVYSDQIVDHNYRLPETSPV